MYPTLTSEYVYSVTDQEIVNVLNPATGELVPMVCNEMDGNVLHGYLFFTTVASRADEYMLDYGGDYSEEGCQKYREYIHHLRSLTDKAAMPRETLVTLLQTNAYIIG